MRLLQNAEAPVLEQAKSRRTRRYAVIACASYWNLTGAHVFEEHLLRGLRGRGVDARLLLTEARTDLVELPNDLIPLPRDLTVEYLPVGRKTSWPDRWVALIRLLSSRAPCIFIPNVDYRHSCVSPKLPSNVCVVGVVHSDDPLHYEHVQRLGRYWDAIVCVSEAIAARVAELDPSLKPRLHFIPNGLKAPERVPERPPDHVLRIVYHGGLNTHQKRILDMAAILDECRRRRIPVRMSIAGDGPEREALLRGCAPHIESGAFRYLGLLPHERVEEVLREHDVYLLPSAFEGLPFALLEAMAQGCVPLVTDIRSSIPELIRNGENGYRVPVGDIGAFADRLQMLQADAALRSRLSTEAHRTLAGSCYEVRAMVESYLRVFDAAMEAAATRAFRRPEGRIAPPPRDLAGISIFPMDAIGWAVDSAENALTPWPGRLGMRLKRLLGQFNAPA
jgi:glycosyltransferase involved in cell wall biosynthesis